MAKAVSVTRFSVQVIEAAALSRRPYRIVLELDEQIVPPVPPAKDTERTGFSAEFAISGAGSGRLTIEKERPLSANGSFALEDSYEFSIAFSGEHPLQFGFITAQPEKSPCAKGGGPSASDGPPPLADVRRIAGLPKGVQLERGKDNGWTVKLTISDPADAVGDMKKPGPTGAAKWHPVAQVFVGSKPSRRALVFAGVHASEPEGIRVAIELLELFRRRGPAAFTTIVIPLLIPRNSPGPDDEGPRYVPSADRGGHSIEPNRNFPMAGHSHATARELGLWYPGGAENLFCGAPQPSTNEKGKREREGQHFAGPPTRRKGLPDLVSTRLLPETALLIALIEELKPDLVVSVHAHQQKPERLKNIGDNAGIFVDPVRGSEKANDKLVSDMLQAFSSKYREAQKQARAARDRRRSPLGAAVPQPDFSWDPLRGNRAFKAAQADLDPALVPLENFRYKPDSENDVQPGTSFGGWAPHPVLEAFLGVKVPRGNRKGIPVVTIECPLADNGDRRRLEQQAEQLSRQAEEAAFPLVAPFLAAAALREDLAARAQREGEKKRRISFADSRIVESIHAQVIYEIALGGPTTP